MQNAFKRLEAPIQCVWFIMWTECNYDYTIMFFMQLGIGKGSLVQSPQSILLSGISRFY